MLGGAYKILRIKKDTIFTIIQIVNLGGSLDMVASQNLDRRKFVLLINDTNVIATLVLLECIWLMKEWKANTHHGNFRNEP